MRITLIVASLKLGGTERVVSFLASGLVKRGHGVTLLTKQDKDRDFYPLDDRVKRRHSATVADSESLDNRSRTIYQRFVSAYRRFQQFRGELRDTSPDIVLSFSNHMNVLTLLASCGLGLPVVVSERNNPRAKPMRFPHSLFRRLLYPRARGFVSPSADLVKMFPYMRAVRTYVIPNPVASIAPRNRSPDELGLRADGPRIFTMGRFAPQKGFDILLKAFSILASRFPMAELVILGDGELREELSALARTLKISDRVVTPGAVDSPQDWLIHASCFVLSSRHEGFPNALLEAMALGLPCVATDCETGPREIIQDRQNGLLIPVDDELALSTAITEILTDEELARRIGEQAKGVHERFGPNAILDVWEQSLCEILSSKASRTRTKRGIL